MSLKFAPILLSFFVFSPLYAWGENSIRIPNVFSVSVSIPANGHNDYVGLTVVGMKKSTMSASGAVTPEELVTLDLLIHQSALAAEFVLDNCMKFANEANQASGTFKVDVGLSDGGIARVTDPDNDNSFKLLYPRGEGSLTRIECGSEIP